MFFVSVECVMVEVVLCLVVSGVVMLVLSLEESVDFDSIVFECLMEFDLCLVWCGRCLLLVCVKELVWVLFCVNVFEGLGREER